MSCKARKEVFRDKILKKASDETLEMIRGGAKPDNIGVLVLSKVAGTPAESVIDSLFGGLGDDPIPTPDPDPTPDPGPI